MRVSVYLYITVGWLPFQAIDQSINQSNACFKQRFRPDSELQPLLNAEPFSLIHAQGELGRPALTTGPTWPSRILCILLSMLLICDKLPKSAFLQVSEFATTSFLSTRRRQRERENSENFHNFLCYNLFNFIYFLVFCYFLNKIAKSFRKILND